MDRFRYVLGLNRLRALEIGHRARHFQDAIVGTRSQALLGHRPFEQSLAIRRKLTKRANVARRHLRIGEDRRYGSNILV